MNDQPVVSTWRLKLSESSQKLPIRSRCTLRTLIA